MATELTTNTNLGDEQIKTLVQAGIIPANTPPAQIAVFAAVCREKGLSAFTKEAYLVSYAGTYSTIVGINGLRKIAAQTGTLAGVDDAQYNVQPDGQFLTASQLKANNKTPNTCTVTVYRIIQGQRCAFTHTAVFQEFSSGKNKWQTMPFQMIAKVAEAFALRKGFSDVATGVTIVEEEVAIMDEQEYSPLDSKRDNLKDLVERCQFDDRKTAVLHARINMANLDGLLAIYHEIKDAIPESDNPAEQFGNRENAASGIKRTVVKNPTT